MKLARKVKRTYASPLRSRQARLTRLGVIRAAAALFAEQGYAATSIEEIAAAAGVGRATVFTSVGGKLALLKAAYDVAIVGDDEPVALPDRPQNRKIIEDPDPRKILEGYAGLLTEMHGRLAGINEALHGAAGADLQARALWQKARDDRHMGARHVVAALEARGPLREGMDAAAAADVLWLHNDPSLYLQLVVHRSWTIERYRDWLAVTLKLQLLPDGSPDD